MALSLKSRLSKVGLSSEESELFRCATAASFRLACGAGWRFSLAKVIGQEAGIRTRTVRFTGGDAAVTPQSRKAKPSHKLALSRGFAPRTFSFARRRAHLLHLESSEIVSYAADMRDPSWVKSRIAARILLRGVNGRLNRRDRTLARRFATDRGVTDRLINQALASICAEKRIPVAEYHGLVQRILATRD